MQTQHLIHETNGCGQNNQTVQKATIVTVGKPFPCHITTQAADQLKEKVLKTSA